MDRNALSAIGFALTDAATESQLLRAKAGDLKAFAATILPHQRSIYSLALRMLGQREIAEDIAQDVFLQLHAKIKSIESTDHLSFWLRRVTIHRAIDYLRRHALMDLTSLDDEPELAGAEDRSDPILQQRLRTLLLTLHPAARAVVALRYQEDLDPGEIARMLGMSINTVKSHLKRSLEILRRSFNEDTPK